MRAFRLAAASALLGLTFSACGGSTAHKAETSETTATAVVSAAGNSDGTSTETAAGPIGPLTFTAVDSAAAEVTVTTAAGGTVTASGADGTTFTLTVPPGAVSADTVVRMTPLADVKGVATTSPILAVRLDPDGTEFEIPVKLAITSPLAAPLRHQLLFQAAHDGTGLAAAEVDPRSTNIELYLWHFSIAGEMGVNDSVVDQVFGVEVGDQMDVLQQRAIDALARARQQKELGAADNGDLPPEVGEAMNAEKKFIADALKSFPTNCSTAKDLINFMTQHEHQGEVMNSTDDNASFWDAAKRAYPICEKQAIRLCKTKHDPAVLIKFWLGWNRQQALIDVGQNIDIGGIQAKADAICLPQRYVVTGGGPGMVVTGKIRDITVAFQLTGQGNGFSVQFLYLPAEPAPESQTSDTTTPGDAASSPEAGRSGTLTYTGSGSDVTMSGSGTYTITGDVGGPLTMTVNTHGCVTSEGGGCRDQTEVLTLTPTRVA